MTTKYQEKQELVGKLVSEGRTVKAIAELSGIPLGSVPHYMKMWGIVFKRAGYEELYGDKIEKIKGLLSNGYTQSQISSLLSIPQSSLYAILTRFGISERNSNSKHDDKRVEAERLVHEGKTARDIGELLDIPPGSLTYLFDKWNLTQFLPRKNGQYHTQAGKERASKKISEAHARGIKSGEHHHYHGLGVIRGFWVSEEDVRSELEYLVSCDLTIAEMAEAMGVDPKTVTNRLKHFDLQKGYRAGARCSWYKGGYRKGRGPDWLQVRQQVLERDNEKCQKCGCTQEEAEARGHRLSAHHIVPWAESRDNSLENLVLLCQTCHMQEEWSSGRWKNNHKEQGED